MIYTGISDWEFHVSTEDNAIEPCLSCVSILNSSSRLDLVVKGIATDTLVKPIVCIYGPYYIMLLLVAIWPIEILVITLVIIYALRDNLSRKPLRYICLAWVPGLGC